MKPSSLDRAWSWASTLPLATLITLLGLYFYSGLASRYEAFYSPLSVNLEDVGLNYSAILARSGEQIVTPLFLILLTYFTFRRLREATTEGEWRSGRAHTGRWRRLRASRAWLKPLGWLILAVVATVAFADYAIELQSFEERTKASVSAVREGRAIDGIETASGRYTLLNVHVREARIESVTNPNPNVPLAVRALVGRPLLYVGQADGTLVLFDPTVDQAVYLPRNSVMLSVGSEPPSGSQPSGSQ
jgi:hypothetical protein